MTKKIPPGLLIKKECLEPLGLSITDGAKLLKVPRPNFSPLVHGEMSISPLMALRLEKVFHIPAKKWLLLQLEYDLAIAKKKFKEKGIKLKKIAKKNLK